MTGAESVPPSVAEIVDAHLAAAGITVSPDEREMYIADYPILRASAARLHEYGDELESSLLFDPAFCYSKEPA